MSETSRLCAYSLCPEKTSVKLKNQLFLRYFLLDVVVHNKSKDILGLWCVNNFLVNVLPNFMLLCNIFQINTFLGNIFPIPSFPDLSFLCNTFPRFTLLFIMVTERHISVYILLSYTAPSPPVSF